MKRSVWLLSVALLAVAAIEFGVFGAASAAASFVPAWLGASKDAPPATRQDRPPCPSHGTAAVPTTIPRAATAVASSGSATIAVKCPSATVVRAAVGHAETGPTTENNTVGGQRTTVCGYAISGSSNGALTSVSFITFSVAAAKAQWAAKETTVSGLGDAAYANPSAGALIVFAGPVMLSINSPGSSSTQLEALARTLLAA